MGRGNDGPILAVLKHLALSGAVDLLVLLATASHKHAYLLSDGSMVESPQEGFEQRVRDVEAAATAVAPGAEIRSHMLEFNPANVDEVMVQTVRALAALPFETDEVHYNVSSGTQAMSAVIAFLAESNLVPRYQVWQVFDPSKVPPGVERVRPVVFGFLSEQGRIDAALKLLETGAFSEAATAFRDLAAKSYFPARRPTAEALSRLAAAYAVWDTGDFSQAHSALTSLREGSATVRLVALGDLIDRQATVLRAIVRGGAIAPGFLHFLRARSERRYRLGHYSAVAVIARRLYEAVLDYHGHMWRVDLSGGSADGGVGLKVKADKLRAELSRSNRTREIARLDALVAVYRTQIAGVRNECIDEHGMNPVTADQAEALLKASAGLVEGATAGTTVQSDGYLYPEELGALTTRLRVILASERGP
jgi:hypothetical protein